MFLLYKCLIKPAIYVGPTTVTGRVEHSRATVVSQQQQWRRLVDTGDRVLIGRARGSRKVEKVFRQRVRESYDGRCELNKRIQELRNF